MYIYIYLTYCLDKALINGYTRNILFDILTHISLASFLWDIGKQCKTTPDAAERGV